MVCRHQRITAIDREDDIMVGEVCKRYMLSWCDRARERLGSAGSGSMLDVARHFEADLRRLAAMPDSA